MQKDKCGIFSGKTKSNKIKLSGHVELNPKTLNVSKVVKIYLCYRSQDICDILGIKLKLSGGVEGDGQ